MRNKSQSNFPYNTENDFSDKTTSVLFLIKESRRWRAKQHGYRRIHSVEYLACLDWAEDALSTQPGCIYQLGTAFSNNIQRQFKPNNIYKLRVRKCLKAPNIFLYISYEEAANDYRLTDILEKRKEPKTVVTPGCIFTLNRPYNEYVGTWKHGCASISIILEIDECSTDTAIQIARWNDIRLAAVLEEIAGTEWLKEWVAESEEETDGFERRLGPPSLLCFFPDGSMQFWFDGGNAFGEHSIVIDVDKENDISSIDICG